MGIRLMLDPGGPYQSSKLFRFLNITIIFHVPGLEMTLFSHAFANALRLFRVVVLGVGRVESVPLYTNITFSTPAIRRVGARGHHPSKRRCDPHGVSKSAPVFPCLLYLRPLVSILLPKSLEPLHSLRSACARCYRSLKIIESALPTGSLLQRMFPRPRFPTDSPAPLYSVPAAIPNVHPTATAHDDNAHTDNIDADNSLCRTHSTPPLLAYPVAWLLLRIHM